MRVGTSRSMSGSPSRPYICKRGAELALASGAVTVPSRPRGRPSKSRVSSAVVLGPDLEQEPRGRLGEEAGRRHDRRRPRLAWARRASETDAPRPPARAISARATARPPSLRSWQVRTSPRLIAAWIARNRARPRSGSTRGTSASFLALDQRPVRAAQLVLRQTGDQQQVARLLQVHRHAAPDVGDLAHRADEQGRGDRQALAFMRVFVVQAVLARDERRAVGDRQVVTRPARPGRASRASRAGRCCPSRSYPASAIRSGSAPTATQFRTASSITQPAIA